VVRIGAVEGSGANVFGNISAAEVLSDGTIVAADNQALQIRFFSPTGEHIRSLGRRGDGPGEYQQIFAIDRFAADSLSILDTFLSRVTVLSADGEVIRVVPLRPPQVRGADDQAVGLPGMRPAHPEANGGWLAVAQPANVPPTGLRPPALATLPILVIRYDDAGQIRDTTVITDGVQVIFATANRDELPPGATSGYQVMLPAASLRTYIVLRTDQVHIADSRKFEIRTFKTDGQLVRKVRYPRLNVSFEQEELTRRRDRALAAAQTAVRRELVMAMLDEAYRPENRPTLSDLQADGAENLWVREWGREPNASTRWLVLNTFGIATAVADMPASYVIRQIGTDGVITVDRDEMNVQYLSLRRWVKPTG
jgi:hypothetical protein